MKRRRNMPGINSSSSADIAFLLLIFFLLISSFETEQGISRKLPPAESESVLPQKMEIQRRNFLLIALDENNKLSLAGRPILFSELKDKVKVFISNPENKEDLPEKISKFFEETGTLETSEKHVIALQVDRNSLYSDYIHVQNELIAAYRELRDSFAMETFNRPYKLLDVRQQTIIRSVYPQKISELKPSTKKTVQ